MKKEKRKPKVYLDTSVYNRPFDDQSQTRIRLETEAFLLIFEKSISKSIIIIASSVLEFENGQNPFHERKERVASYLSVAAKSIKLTNAIKNRAMEIENAGMPPIDALHLACAESNADYFLTCDDGIIKKARRRKETYAMEICNPLEFILQEVFKNA